MLLKGFPLGALLFYISNLRLTHVSLFRVIADIHGSDTDLIVGARNGLAKLDPSTGEISYLCKFWTSDGPEIEQRYVDN